MYGRTFKSLHILAYIDTDETYRRDIKSIRNLQEGRHALGRKICHGKKDELYHRYERGLENQLGALGLVLNCVTLWTTVYLDAAIRQLRAQGYPVLEEDMTRLSPFVSQHLGVYLDMLRTCYTAPVWAARRAMIPAVRVSAAKSGAAQAGQCRVQHLASDCGVATVPRTDHVHPRALVSAVVEAERGALGQCVGDRPAQLAVHLLAFRQEHRILGRAARRRVLGFQDRGLHSVKIGQSGEGARGDRRAVSIRGEPLVSGQADSAQLPIGRL